MGATDLTLQPVRAPDPDRPGEEVLHSPSQLARLQPDGVVVHEAKRRIVLLEFTRPNDGWDDALWQAAARKDGKYRLLLHALRGYARAGWTVQLHALPVGVMGTLHLAHWVPAMETVGISHGSHRRIMQVAARESIRGMHFLHLCRHQLRHAPLATTLQSRVAAG